MRDIEGTLVGVLVEQQRQLMNVLQSSAGGRTSEAVVASVAVVVAVVMACADCCVVCVVFDPPFHVVALFVCMPTYATCVSHPHPLLLQLLRCPAPRNNGRCASRAQHRRLVVAPAPHPRKGCLRHRRQPKPKPKCKDKDKHHRHHRGTVCGMRPDGTVARLVPAPRAAMTTMPRRPTTLWERWPGTRTA